MVVEGEVIGLRLVAFPRVGEQIIYNNTLYVVDRVVHEACLSKHYVKEVK